MPGKQPETTTSQEKETQGHPGQPKVAIIIDDLGYDAVMGKKMLALPIELTYSFLPFAPHTRDLAELARQDGKTIFLHLPLQPKGAAYDPGPGALYLGDAPEVQRAKLRQCLEEVADAAGVNNHMGSSFTEDEQAMTNIMQEIRERSLIFVDSITSPRSVAFRVARTSLVRSARRSVFLDNVQDTRKICGQLEKLAAIAEKNGAAVGIGHPYRATAEAIAECAGNYDNRVQFVTVPEILAAVERVAGRMSADQPPGPR